jgi:hypothetical protein
MLPLIISGVILGTMYVLRTPCHVCDRKIRPINECMYCGKRVCVHDSSQVSEALGWCCDEHGDALQATSNAHRVELVSANYKGRKQDPVLGRTLQTGIYRDKDTATAALKFMAALNQTYYVQEVEHTPAKASEGNYVFTTWTCKGLV